MGGVGEGGGGEVGEVGRGGAGLRLGFVTCLIYVFALHCRVSRLCLRWQTASLACNHHNHPLAVPRAGRVSVCTHPTSAGPELQHRAQELSAAQSPLCSYQNSRAGAAG